MRAIICIVLLLGLFLTLVASGTRAIICEDMDEWQTFEDHVHSAMIADGAIQERWSYPKIHPVDGRIAFVVETRMEKYLSVVQRGRIVELPDDWAPIPEGL